LARDFLRAAIRIEPPVVFSVSQRGKEVYRMNDMGNGRLIVGHVIDDAALRRMMARDVMRAGRLPRRPADRMWGSAGKDTNCTICTLAITSQEPGYELQFTEDGRDWTIHFLHIRCFAAWESECRNGKSASRTDRHDEATRGNGHVNGHRRGTAP
jgi:hypothetical protein